MIKYIGSKRVLLSEIESKIDKTKHKTVVDLFSGTSRVGHMLKKKGYSVIANDYAEYAKVLADAYVLADRKTYLPKVKSLVEYYNSSTDKTDGYFTDTFCRQSKYFHVDNGQKIDWIRENIESTITDSVLKNVMIASLMEAADRVDSTAGIQMAYVKKPPKRFFNHLQLRIPDMIDNTPGNTYQSHKGDSNEFVKNVAADVVYIDPPYNQHSYLGNYHIWETLCLWDKPAHYGIACKREDTRTRKSDYNFKRKAYTIMQDLVSNLNCRRAIISFNDEGYINRMEMESLLKPLGSLTTYSIPHKRYVGSKIGVHNPQGVKVGKASHPMCNEFIYVLDF